MTDVGQLPDRYTLTAPDGTEIRDLLKSTLEQYCAEQGAILAPAGEGFEVRIPGGVLKVRKQSSVNSRLERIKKWNPMLRAIK